MTGVYCLANDVVLEQLIAFVKSFRKYNPILPLTIIEFDSRTEKIKELSKQYNFKVWAPLYGKELEEIGLKFYPGNAVWAKGFKKFAAFWGEYDTFLVCDSDIVINEDLGVILETYTKHPNAILYWDYAEAWVYKEGPFKQKMINTYNTAFINAGFWGAHKGQISYQYITDIMKDFALFRNEMEDVMEQPFVNYCIDLKHLEKINVTTLCPDIAFTVWYNIDIVYKNDKLYWRDKDKLVKMTGIHWAGLGFSAMHKNYTSEFFLHYRLLNESMAVKFRHFLRFHHLRKIDVVMNPKFYLPLFRLLFN